MNFDDRVEMAGKKLDAVGALPLVTEMNDAIDESARNFYKYANETMAGTDVKLQAISFAAGFFWGCIAMFREGGLREKVFACQRYIKKVSEENKNEST